MAVQRQIPPRLGLGMGNGKWEMGNGKWKINWGAYSLRASLKQSTAIFKRLLRTFTDVPKK